jgi:Ca2+:H+ antiporter
MKLPKFVGLNLLLIAIPLALIARVAGWSDGAIFALSALAIIPLANLIGKSTEVVAERLGPQLGGLLNATLGNAAELIITIFALQRGLTELVRASIIGSILGNVLLVMGLSMLVGGLRHGTQRFDRRGASINATLMVLAFATLAIPSLFDPAVVGEVKNAESLQRELFFSISMAVVMITLYVFSIVYSLRNPPPAVVATTEATAEKTDAAHGTAGASNGNGNSKPAPIAHTPHAMPTPEQVRAAVFTLIFATLAIVLMSETLVGTVENVVKQFNLSELFVGIIIVPLIGNVAEHFVAIQVAAKNRMDLSVTISIGSSLQIALFVAPVLVFISLLFPTPLLLVFNRYELIALAVASAIGMFVAQDGESNWLEGLELLAVYLMIGLAFFVIPAALHFN